MEELLDSKEGIFGTEMYEPMVQVHFQCVILPYFNNKVG
jgi:hypothetical protein